MTEANQAISPNSDPSPTEPVAGASSAEAPPTGTAPLPGAEPRRRDGRSGSWMHPWFLVALVALGLAGWQWFETRVRLAGMQEEMNRRLADAEGTIKENRGVSRQAQEEVARLQAKLGGVEARLTEAQGQQAALENLYQELARNRDDWVLAEVEQSISLAAQQLQLSGNLPAAVLALQNAESRLARAERPQWLSLRKIVLRDLERLRAIPAVDVPGMSLRLEHIVVGADTLPLAFEARAREGAKDGGGREPAPRAGDKTDKAGQVPAGDATAGNGGGWSWLAHLGGEIWGELRGLLRIQRTDRPEPALLSPSQAFFLRENLKLRLLNARLALLSRDQWTFRNELGAAQGWIEKYFDGEDRNVQSALATLRQQGSTELVVDLPNLADSLAAVRAIAHPVKERK